MGKFNFVGNFVGKIVGNFLDELRKFYVNGPLI